MTNSNMHKHTQTQVVQPAQYNTNTSDRSTAVMLLLSLNKWTTNTNSFSSKIKSSRFINSWCNFDLYYFPETHDVNHLLIVRNTVCCELCINKIVFTNKFDTLVLQILPKYAELERYCLKYHLNFDAYRRLIYLTLHHLPYNGTLSKKGSTQEAISIRGTFISNIQWYRLKT